MSKEDNTIKVTPSAGRPSNAVPTDLESLKTRSLHEIAKFDAKMVNKLPKLYSMLEDIAFGTGELGKQASITNRKSSIETLIVRGELYAKGEGMAQEAYLSLDGEDGQVEETTVETKLVSNGEPALSFAEKKALWDAKKADK